MKFIGRRFVAFSLILALSVPPAMAMPGRLSPTAPCDFLTQAVIQPSPWRHLAGPAAFLCYWVRQATDHIGRLGVNLEGNDFLDQIVNIVHSFGSPMTLESIAKMLKNLRFTGTMKLEFALQILVRQDRLKQITAGDGQERETFYAAVGAPPPALEQFLTSLPGPMADYLKRAQAEMAKADAVILRIAETAGLSDAMRFFLINAAYESTPLAEGAEDKAGPDGLSDAQLSGVLRAVHVRWGLSFKDLERQCHIPERRLREIVKTALEDLHLKKEERRLLHEGLLVFLKHKVHANKRFRVGRHLPYPLPANLFDDSMHDEPMIDAASHRLYRRMLRNELLDWRPSDSDAVISAEELGDFLRAHVYHRSTMRRDYALRAQGRIVAEHVVLSDDQIANLTLVSVAEEIINEFGISRQAIEAAQEPRPPKRGGGGAGLGSLAVWVAAFGLLMQGHSPSARWRFIKSPEIRALASAA